MEVYENFDLFYEQNVVLSSPQGVLNTISSMRKYVNIYYYNVV